MTDRPNIPKKLRFEVFKRDRFTCQYCGAKAPEAVLHADHIEPVVAGGATDLLNLITACAGCNLGKGARRLDDRSAVEKQRAQIEELEERREQLEMMLAWRDIAQAEKVDTAKAVSDRCEERGGYVANDNGLAKIRRWLSKYGLEEVLVALDQSFDAYMAFDGDEPRKEAWELAFAKIPAFASMNRQAKSKPYMPRLLYVQGILRRRTKNKRLSCVDALESFHVEDDLDLDDLERVAKCSDTWDEFCLLADEAARGRF